MKKFRWMAAMSLGLIVLIAPFTVNGQSAENLFLDKCANCHGKDGAGQTVTGKKLKPRDLRSPEAQKLTDEQMTEIISKGRKDMPGYAKQLADKQIKDLAAYLRTLAKK